MKVVIVGAGVVGFQIARQLIAEKKDVVLIEKDALVAKHADNQLDCQVIQGEGTHLETLEKAGIRSANVFIGVTSLDEVNWIACVLVASEFQVPLKIARVRNIGYIDSRLRRHRLLGVDYFVNPETEAAKLIADAVAEGAYSDVLPFSQTDIQMRRYIVGDRSPFRKIKLKQIRAHFKEEFLIAGIFRDGKVFIPSGNDAILTDDVLQIVAGRKVQQTLFSRIGVDTRQEIRNILVVGGSRIGILATQQLRREGRRFKIIESDYNRCKELTQVFPDSVVVNADITDESIWDEEHLFDNDLILTATDHQELNILTGAYAKTVGVKKALALVQKASYMKIAAKIGIDVSVCPKDCAVDSILKHVRRGHVKSVHTLFEGQAQVIEFLLPEGSRAIHKTVRKLKMPAGSLILVVIREDGHHIPGGDFVLQPGDTLVVLCTLASISKIEDLFMGKQ